LARALVNRRIYGNERGGERALSQQSTERVGNAQRGAEGIGRGAVAEVVREDALAHVAEDAGDEDAGRHVCRVTSPPAPPAAVQRPGLLRRGCCGRPCLSCRSSRIPPRLPSRPLT